VIESYGFADISQRGFVARCIIDLRSDGFLLRADRRDLGWVIM